MLSQKHAEKNTAKLVGIQGNFRSTNASNVNLSASLRTVAVDGHHVSLTPKPSTARSVAIAGRRPENLESRLMIFVWNVVSMEKFYVPVSLSSTTCFQQLLSSIGCRVESPEVVTVIDGNTVSIESDEMLLNVCTYFATDEKEKNKKPTIFVGESLQQLVGVCSFVFHNLTFLAERLS